jgi:hypothetical protein
MGAQGFENQIAVIRNSLENINLDAYDEVYLESGSDTPKFFVWALLSESGFKGKVTNGYLEERPLNPRTLAINLFPCQDLDENSENFKPHASQEEIKRIYSCTVP